MHLLVKSLVILPLLGTLAMPAPAAEHGGDADVPTASSGKAVNSIDPITGRPVVSSIPTLSIRITANANKDGSTPAETVVIGFSDQSSRDQIQRADMQAREQYAQAAKQNRTVRDGRISGEAGSAGSASGGSVQGGGSGSATGGSVQGGGTATGGSMQGGPNRSR